MGFKLELAKPVSLASKLLQEQSIVLTVGATEGSYRDSKVKIRINVKISPGKVGACLQAMGF